MGCPKLEISQIATEANKKVLAAIASLADCYRGDARFPTWRTIDEWCDGRPKERKRLKLQFVKQKRGKRIYKRVPIEDPAIVEWQNASELNINRVTSSLGAGIAPEDIGTALNIPTTTAEDPNHNPTANLVKLAEYRRIAEEQDRETQVRLERYRVLKQAEMLGRSTRATLTLKGYEKAIELEQHTTEAESRPTVAEGSDQTPSAGKVSAA